MKAKTWYLVFRTFSGFTMYYSARGWTSSMQCADIFHERNLADAAAERESAKVREF